MLATGRERTLVAAFGLIIAVGCWLAWQLTHPRSAPGASAASAVVPNTALDVSSLTSAPEVSPAETVQPNGAHEQVPDAGIGTWVRPRSEEVFWGELTRLRAVDKEQALKYALLGEQWYSSLGRPAEARRAMIISLLVDLDQMEEARSRTRAFIEAYPSSSYRVMVQGVTGIHPRPGAPAGYQSQTGSK